MRHHHPGFLFGAVGIGAITQSLGASTTVAFALVAAFAFAYLGMRALRSMYMLYRAPSATRVWFER